MHTLHNWSLNFLCQNLFNICHRLSNPSNNDLLLFQEFQKKKKLNCFVCYHIVRHIISKCLPRRRRQNAWENNCLKSKSTQGLLLFHLSILIAGENMDNSVDHCQCLTPVVVLQTVIFLALTTLNWVCSLIISGYFLGKANREFT